MNNLENLKNPDTTKPILLFKENDYEIYWLGLNQESAFRVNVYLVKSGDEAVIIDPGNRNFFNPIKKEVIDIMGSTDKVVGVVFCHQDPDVAASVVNWLDIRPDMKVLTTPRTNVLLPFYGIKGEYDFFDVTQNDFVFSNGKKLEFIEAPFLHFSGAVTTYCPSSKFLFSGDIFAALDIEWSLIVEDFTTHTMAMDLFSKDYFPCNKATKGFALKIENEEINAVLPQHGSIIPKKFVKNAIDYLKNLKCGLDLIYPQLD